VKLQARNFRACVLFLEIAPVFARKNHSLEESAKVYVENAFALSLALIHLN